MKARLLVFLSPLLASACATARVDVKYAPSRSAEPLAMSRKPRLYLSEVDDRSPGFSYHGMGLTTKGALTRPITETVRDALRVELERLGLPVAATRADADAVFQSAVTATAVTLREGANVPVDSTLSVSFRLRSLVGELLWSNEFTGRGSKKVLAPGFPGSVPSESLSQALDDVMGKLSRALEEEGALKRVFASPALVQAPTAAPAAPAPVRIVSDVDQLPAQSARRGGHAVIIGVENYREKLPAAEFAAADAKLVAEYAKRVLGYSEENVALLTGDRATRGDFQKYFESWLPNRVEKGDEVFVYFSGHGAPDAKTGDAFLVPYDGDPTYIDQTGYSIKRMYAALAKLPAKRVLVAMDSCFSGAGGRSVIARGARPLVSLRAASVPDNLTVLSASAGDQISNSYLEKGHGLFTYFFLKGLKERGADFSAVYEYLRPEVAKVARRNYNTDQTPQLMGGR